MFSHWLLYVPSLSLKVERRTSYDHTALNPRGLEDSELTSSGIEESTSVTSMIPER